MKKLAGLLLFVGASLAAAAPVPDTSQLLTVAARLDAADGAKSGTLRLDARLASGWHVNSHVPSEDYLIATAAKVDPQPYVQTGDPRYPSGKMKKFSFAEKPLSVYEDRFTIEIPVTWTGSGPPALTGSLDFQACNDTQCLPPASLRFRVATDAAAGAGVLTGGAVPLSEAPPSGRVSTAAAGASRDFGNLLERRGLPVVLMLLFAGGLALNLTPCVYPVIPLTVSFFGGQAKGAGGRPFGLAALYVLGMATMYSTLGVAAALSGKLFGVALQSPWVLGGIALALTALALSMFGLYDIRMPSSWMQKTGARSGRAGAFAMGLLVGIVAAPCVGPFVLGLLAFVAARQNAPLGFLLFFVLALGLGVPYLFLGAFSGALARLPRAGEWMVGVKKIFGWILLAMAAYFLRTALPAPAGDWLLPAVLVTAAVFLGIGSRTLKPGVRVAAALLFLAAAVFFLPRRSSAGADGWRPYSAAEVARAGRPAVVDFSAEWCAPCKELDEKTLADSRVRVALSRRSLYRADLTKAGSPESAELSRKYAILGVPTVIFLDATGQERRELRLVGYESPDAFLARLEKAP